MLVFPLHFQYLWNTFHALQQNAGLTKASQHYWKTFRALPPAHLRQCSGRTLDAIVDSSPSRGGSACSYALTVMAVLLAAGDGLRVRREDRPRRLCRLVLAARVEDADEAVREEHRAAALQPLALLLRERPAGPAAGARTPCRGCSLVATLRAKKKRLRKR